MLSQMTITTMIMSNSPKAKTMLSLITITTIVLLLSNTTTSQKFYETTLNPEALGFGLGLPLGREKLTRLRFYFHDTLSGKKPSAVRVASTPETESLASGFGFVAVMDDPMTVEPDLSSTRIGSGQGIYVAADQNKMALLMVHTYFFTAGEFNGSTLSVLGRNGVFDEERELPIVGGSGWFRFARGYIISKTYSHNVSVGNTVREHNVYVLHY